MKNYSLTCPNCTAPLELLGEAKNLKCGYCGSPQVLERSGEAEPVDEIDATHEAIRRDSARRSAEIEIDLLMGERDEVLEKKKEAIAAHAEKLASGRTGRRNAALTALVVMFFIGGAMAQATEGHPTMSTLLSFVWLVALVGVPIYVYRKTKVPDTGASEDIQWCDRKLAHIDRRLTEYRAMADKLTY